MTDRIDQPDDELLRNRRQLELVDRILGLEAQLANQVRLTSPTLEQVQELQRDLAGLQQQLDAVHSTMTWRAGRAVLTPVRAIKRLLPGSARR